MKTWKQSLKHLTSKEYELLKEMCHLSKNVVNESIYNIRQYYFTDKKYLNYKSNYAIEKTSENYINLGSNVSQQSI